MVNRNYDPTADHALGVVATKVRRYAMGSVQNTFRPNGSPTIPTGIRLSLNGDAPTLGDIFAWSRLR